MTDAAEPPELVSSEQVSDSDSLRCTLGAAGGALAGYLLFSFLASIALYAPMIPGALTGIGCGMGARKQSHLRAIGCTFFATLLNIWSEWRHFPFVTDGSFSYFMTHIQDLQQRTLLMYAVSAAIAYYFAFARQGRKPVPSK